MRRTLVGASEAPALMGADDYDVSEWMSRLDVYANKVGQPQPLRSQPVILGTCLEDGILRAYAELSGRECIPVGVLQRDAAAPHLGATLDAIRADDDAVVQVKYTSRPPYPGRIPLAYEVQTNVEMAISGRETAILLVLHPGELRDYPVPRNEALIALVRETVERFWRDHVEARRPPAPPPPGYVPLSIVEALHPRDNGSTVALSEAAADADGRLAEIAETMTALVEERERLRAAVALEIGDATYGALPAGGQWKWAWQVTEEFRVPRREQRILRRLKRRQR